MVDRIVRDRFAADLRHFVCGRLTNDAFEARLPPHSEDRGVTAVRSAAWLLYSDLYTHRLTGRHRPDSEGRRQIARWILFLHSDLEYEWPEALEGPTRLILGVISIGLMPRMLDRRWRTFGEFEVWPFLRMSDFEAARKQPRR